MRQARGAKGQFGFTLIELLAALGIFLLVTGAAFTLLSSSQQRFQTESQVMTSFQEARLGLDQIVRDVNDAGYPPPTFYATAFPTYSASTPFAWSPNYTISSPCTLGITCITPGDFDLIIETNPTPQSGGPVQWIRYQLQVPPTVPVPTLMRGTAPKQLGDDPAVDTGLALVPFVQNVVNNSPDLQVGQFQLFAAYPLIFTAGGSSSIPIFSYTCDTPTVPQYPLPVCSAAGVDNSPANIRDVVITLIVAAPLPDATTGQPRLIQLSGRGRRVNPNQ